MALWLWEEITRFEEIYTRVCTGEMIGYLGIRFKYSKEAKGLKKCKICGFLISDMLLNISISN